MADALKQELNFSVIHVLGVFLALSSVCVWLFRQFNKGTKEVIIFTRYPIPGKAKTRLIPALGAAAAAKLQQCMTEHMLHVLHDVYTAGRQLNVTLQYNGGSESDMKFWIQRKLSGLKCSFRLQAEGNLGDKMRSAVKDSFNRGNKQVIVIGADIPGITSAVIQEAFSKLQQAEHDLVIGRAEDGGYYLIGFNTQALKYIDDIFDDITWGTETVFQQQMCRAKLLNAHPAVLSTMLQDVDTEGDISVFEREVGVARQELCPTTWSIIIPTLNEENNILKCLNNIVKNISERNVIKEILIGDGGSTDETVKLVKQYASTVDIPIRVVTCKPGRGNQLSQCADEATASRFLFVHADSHLPAQYDSLAAHCLASPGIVAGAFKFQLDVLSDQTLKASEPWWFILQMKLLVWGANKRALTREKPYGDQALFLDRRTYRHIGGFPPYFLMEDYILVEKLRTIGHIGIVDQPMITSYRRWRKWGYTKVTGLSQLIILAYHCGVHPNTLAKWYYGDKIKIT